MELIEVGACSQSPAGFTSAEGVPSRRTHAVAPAQLTEFERQESVAMHDPLAASGPSTLLEVMKNPSRTVSRRQRGLSGRPRDGSLGTPEPKAS
jgi:hypothetical protein